MAKGTEKTVAWFLPKKAMIKFEGDDESYAVATNVMEVSDFDKYPVLKGDSVNVSIEGEEVTFLRKLKGDGKKSGSSSKSTSSGDKETKTLTVEAIYNNESVKFKDEKINNKKWTKVSDEIKEKGLAEVGLVAKNEVEITLDNGVIVAVKVGDSGREETKSDEEKTQSSSKKSSWRDEDATDKRTAVMSAKDIVVALINNKEIEKPDVKEVLADLTKTCYKAIQDLN